MLEKPCGNLQMPSAITAEGIAADARQLVIFAAGERGWNTSRDAWLASAAKKLGLTFRRARSIFYGERIRLSADEYLLLIQRSREIERGIAQQRALQHDVTEILERTRAVLDGGSPDRGGDRVDDNGRQAGDDGAGAVSGIAARAESVRRG